MAQSYLHDDEILGAAYDGRLMRRLFGYVRPYRGLASVALVALLLLALIEIAPSVVARSIIDAAIVPTVNGEIPVAEGMARLAPLGLLYLGLLIGAALLRYGQHVLVNYVGQKAMYDLRVELFRHLQGLSLTFFDRNPVGRLMTRITNDIDALIELVTNGLVAIVGDVVLLVGTAVVLLLLDWRLGLITLLVVPVVLALTAYFRKLMRESFRAVRIRIARINAYLNENLSGMSVVQLFTRENWAFARFDELNMDHLRANQGSIRAMSLFQPLVLVTRAGTAAAVFLAGGYWILGGELTLGTLVAFWQLVEQFFRPIQDLSEKYGILQSAMASSERVFRLLDTPATVTDPPDPIRIGHVRGEIAFERVSFAYDQEWVLRDVDIRIAAGERVAIVGATGAGKTSIISLIQRFYDVQRGRVLLDGVDVRAMAQGDLRRHVGMVLQDPFVFAGTVASNIRLHDASITDEQVRAAARFVNAEPFVNRLPQGYETVVAERGATLSVGQRQLLAFARAIAFNPEVLLLLDEATSSVDTEVEHLIQDALRKLMQGRTSIVIAHRLSTIQDVDRIIVLHKGRVVETGSHRELLASGGVYRRLYELQYRPHEMA